MCVFLSGANKLFWLGFSASCSESLCRRVFRASLRTTSWKIDFFTCTFAFNECKPEIQIVQHAMKSRAGTEAALRGCSVGRERLGRIGPLGVIIGVLHDFDSTKTTFHFIIEESRSVGDCKSRGFCLSPSPN